MKYYKIFSDFFMYANLRRDLDGMDKMIVLPSQSVFQHAGTTIKYQVSMPGPLKF